MTRKLFTTILPSMIAGGLVFGSAFGRADDGRAAGGFWPMADIGPGAIAQADPPKAPKAPVPPTPPKAQPAAPVPPTPPKAPKAGGGVSVSIHDGKVEIDGVQDLVNDQIDAALGSLKTTNLPPDARKQLEEHLGKLRATLAKRLGSLKSGDMEQFGKEMEEFGKEMDQFGKEMDQWGDKLGKDMAKQVGRHAIPQIHIGRDDDDDDDASVPSVPDIDDQDELDDAVADLGDLSLKPPQRDQIAKLRTDSDKQVAAAKQALDRASEALHKQLENPAATDAEIAKAIDAVTQQEAAIRKARILAWVNARRVLDDAQRKKVEGANKPK